MKNTITILFLIITSLLFAQKNSNVNHLTDDDVSKNAMYLSIGSILFYSSAGINYDRRLFHTTKGFFKNYNLNLEGGVFNLNSGFGLGPDKYGVMTSLRAIGLTGRKKQHFETILGVSLHMVTEVRNNGSEDRSEEEIFFFPDIAFGYRYQKRNGILFRVGIGFPRSFYMGAGYSF